ncbi:MAG: formylglycine-generating enzyme family protein [Treponema sp.]|nr:formylglycine-generating enzyme family protein [Treponema sp.]
MKRMLFGILVMVGLVLLTCSEPPSDPPSNDGNNNKPDYRAMVQITGTGTGSFLMGSPVGEVNRNSDETQWLVKLSNFKISKYPVTQEWFQDVMGYNPSFFVGANLPVEEVTWFDAIEFCNKLSELQNLEPVYYIDVITRNSFGNITNATVTELSWDNSGYRLPTEAQWEYACRAGTTTPFNWGTNQITSDQANFNATASLYNGSPVGVYRARTTPVDIFPANAWRLHDMHGNVFEWCWDWYGTYPTTVQLDYKGASSGSGRVLRGGGYYNGGGQLRSAFRVRNAPFDVVSRIGGFRVVAP